MDGKRIYYKLTVLPPTFKLMKQRKKKIKNTFTDKPTIEEINEATQKC